jgi:gluconokinase
MEDKAMAILSRGSGFASTVTRHRAESPLVMALDIGSSSVRGVLFDRAGRAVDGVEAQQALEISTSADGASEADPEVVLELISRCVDGVIVRAGPMARQIAAVATCTFVNNIMGLDRSGQAITPLMTYADTRSEGDVPRLRAEFDEGAVHDRTGCHFHSSYLPARFRWLERAQPDLFHRVKRWVSIGEYLELKLFGDTAVTYSVASWTGLLDRQRLVWDEQLLEVLPVRREQLSALTDANIARYGLEPQYATRWPGLHDVAWFPAVGDGAAANIGSGCVCPEKVALTVGTTSAMRAIVEGPVAHIPSGLWCYRVDRRRSLPGGALSEGGNVFAWINNSMKLGDLSKVDSDLAVLAPDAHGLTILPFFAGERSPGWAGHARATIHGLSLATTPLDILRAGLEAVAYRIAMVFEPLCKLLRVEPEVVANGKALLSSSTWLQIMADVLGRPVAISDIQEASARGAALLALEGLGVLEDLKQAAEYVRHIYQPDPQRHAVYRAAIDHQRELYVKLVQHETRKREQRL